MAVPAIHADRPVLRIRGTSYPVLLPRLRDPRLHLAATIISLQVLGQVAFDFDLSIAQILVALVTCAVIEVTIAFRRDHVIMWPASALLTGNGVAFVLRVPGTEHGDWWSMRGWWIYAGTAAFAILSKYLIRFRGRHIFNPSNLGLVVCFLLLGPELADPLAFWWGPLSPWMVLALAIIVTGGLAILGRLHLLVIAVGFWVTFALGIGAVVLAGHEMTARWHLGPITGIDLWRVLVFSPEVLVFLFFMITDPRTIPESARGRRVYAVAIGLLAVLLMAPFTTEFAMKVALLGALTIACAARPPLLVLGESRFGARARAAHPASRRGIGVAVSAGVLVFLGALVLAGIPARPGAEVAAASTGATQALPAVAVGPSVGVATTIDAVLAQRLARDVVSAVAAETDALRQRDRERAATAATGAELQQLWQRIGTGARSVVVPVPTVERMTVSLEADIGQGQPHVIADLTGTELVETWRGTPPSLATTVGPQPFDRTLELVVENGRYVVTRTRRGGFAASAPSAAQRLAAAKATGLGAIRLTDVASQVGLRFRHGAFRFGVMPDTIAMMGGGVCWLDVDNDGWLDLYAVNSHADSDIAAYDRRGGLPRNGLFRNVHGRFVDVSRGSGADLPMRGNGCVAADFDGDGFTDLFVTSGSFNVATNGYDALLWNNGNGTFTEGAVAAGVSTGGWHSGAAVADVNGDGRLDLFVAGYTDPNAPVQGAPGGFPSNFAAVPDHLYLNLGPGTGHHARFRDVTRASGVAAAKDGHGLGATFTDVNGDGRLDLYVANDTDPNRLFLNVVRQDDPRHLGFRLVERGVDERVADPNAGMGIAAGDYDGDGRTDLVITNSHHQLHAVYRNGGVGQPFVDDRPVFSSSFDTELAGWGASWVDLDNDGDLDLAYVNGGIPITGLTRGREPVKVLGSRLAQGAAHSVADASRLVGLGRAEDVNGRGLAAADFDNDGDVDLAVSSIGGKLLLLRNTGARGSWLTVRTRSLAPGARVTAVLPDGRRIVRDVQAGSSYLSSEDPRAHLGLGRARRVSELTVRLPDGRTITRRNVAVNRIITLG